MSPDIGPIEQNGTSSHRAVVDGRTARRDSTRAKVIHAAAELFAGAGFSATSVEDVCEAAGVSKGSVFYNFSSKDGLCQAVIESGISALALAIETGRAGRYGRAALVAAAEEILGLVVREQRLCHVAWTELLHNGRPWSSRLPEYRAQVLDPVTELLQEIELELRSGGECAAAPPRYALESTAMAFLGGLIFSALDHLVYQPEQPLRYVHGALMATLASHPD